MITWNWSDTDCKNEWAIFTRLISLAGPLTLAGPRGVGTCTPPSPDFLWYLCNEIRFWYKTLAIADRINNGFLEFNKIKNGLYIMEKY